MVLHELDTSTARTNQQAAAGGGGVSFVGETSVYTQVNSTSDLTVDLTDITGLSDGDYVVFHRGDSLNNSIPRTLVSTGWTEISQLNVVDTHRTNISLWGKFMGATPDSSVVATGLSSASFALVGKAYAFRGVSVSSPTGTPVEDQTGNTFIEDMSAITPVNSGAHIVSVYGCGSTRWSATVTQTGGDTFDSYTDLYGGGSTTRCNGMMGRVVQASGAFDPGTWQPTGQTDAALYSAGGISVEILPA